MIVQLTGKILKNHYKLNKDGTRVGVRHDVKLLNVLWVLILGWMKAQGDLSSV